MPKKPSPFSQEGFGDKYAYSEIDLLEIVAQTEPDPQWISSSLSTKHTIKLEGELYQQLKFFFRDSQLPKQISIKEIEVMMDKLINRLIKEFLSQQTEV